MGEFCSFIAFNVLVCSGSTVSLPALCKSDWGAAEAQVELKLFRG